MSLDDLDLLSQLELDAILSSNDLESGLNQNYKSRTVLITGLTNRISGEALRQMCKTAGEISEV
jgi:hypothetical protein